MAKPLKVSEEVRMRVIQRSHFRCERCEGELTGAFGFSVHHRRPRMMGGSNNPNLHLPSNLIVLCGSGITGCHGWVESHRIAARNAGYLLYGIDNPLEILFEDIKGYCYRLDNDGMKTLVEFHHG